MENITIRQYSKLKNTMSYDTILNHLNPINKFGNGVINFDKLTYIEVKKCVQLLKNINGWKALEELFCLAYGIKAETTYIDSENSLFSDKVIGFWDIGVVEYFSARNFLLKSFRDLMDRESKLLKSIDVDMNMWIEAGGESLNNFSNLLPLVQLGEIYKIYPYDLQFKPYNEILTLLVCHKRKAEVDKKMNKLNMKKK